MANPKHTPGPWHVGMKPGPMIYGPNGEWVADMSNTTLPDDERMANVHIVRSATELLEALMIVRTLMGEIDADAGPVATILNELDAAVARAKGGKP